MIIDHNHPLYAKKRNSLTNGNKYNGKILLEKVDPTAEEIIEALYNQH